MKKDELDVQMKEEIERLNKSEAVKLAWLELRPKYKHRQYLYTPRNLEKRGKRLMEEGITGEQLKEMCLNIPDGFENDGESE